jgi:hypothetical protein
VSKHWNPPKAPRGQIGLKPAAPKPSRIRREPPPLEKPASLEKALWRQSRELEIGLAIVGMILFALGIDAAMYLFAGFVAH